MKYILASLLCMGFIAVHAQIKFKLVEIENPTGQSIYYLVDEENKTIRVLDTAKYYVALSGFEYGYFAILGIKGTPGWSAIDAEEQVLFQVYNTNYGEPSPDYLREGKIRIVDEENRIGFANEKGQIIIAPQFEMASSFHRGFAIIGAQCTQHPWGEPENEDGCRHYSVECARQGYINDKGKVLKMGDYTFDQIKAEINWEPEDE